MYEAIRRTVELKAVILSSKLKFDILPVEMGNINPPIEAWGKRDVTDNSQRGKKTWWNVDCGSS
jgi:hypothetical protein